MKTKLIAIVCVLAVTFGSANSSFADDDPGMLMITDMVVIRPACFVATAIGSAFFVVSLPFSAMSRSTKKAAHALVTTPAKATFTRPLGDMDALLNH
jgi:hypothetical protein